MLIKEYRIPLPLSVEEYKVAQLYMIAVRELPFMPFLLFMTFSYLMISFIIKNNYKLVSKTEKE